MRSDYGFGQAWDEQRTRNWKNGKNQNLFSNEGNQSQSNTNVPWIWVGPLQVKERVEYCQKKLRKKRGKLETFLSRLYNGMQGELTIQSHKNIGRLHVIMKNVSFVDFCKCMWEGWSLEHNIILRHCSVILVQCSGHHGHYNSTSCCHPSADQIYCIKVYDVIHPPKTILFVAGLCLWELVAPKRHFRIWKWHVIPTRRNNTLCDCSLSRGKKRF